MQERRDGHVHRNRDRWSDPADRPPGASVLTAVDQARYDELIRKRDTVGLTREEADELGRLLAEREGRLYSNADKEQAPDQGTSVRRDDRSFPGPKSEAGP